MESQDDVDLLVGLFFQGQDEDDEMMYNDADDCLRIMREFIQEKENMRKGKSNPKPLQDMIDYNSKNIVMKKEQIQSLQSHYRNTKAEYDRIIARLKTLE